MNSCELNPKEIMCIAAGLGATELYGIPDEFSGISESNISNEILKVQSSLEEKGYLKENFDGETTLNGDIKKIVDVCANCEKFIAIDKQIKHKTQEGILIYVKGTLAVIANKDVNSYKMQIIDSSSIFNSINDTIIWKNETPDDQFSYRVKNKTLLKAKQLKSRNADEVASKELIAEGVSSAVAKTILSGFEGNEDFYSFTFADLISESNNVNNVMYIFASSSIIRIKSIMEDEEDIVCFQNASKAGVEAELKAMYDGLGITGEVFM